MSETIRTQIVVTKADIWNANREISMDAARFSSCPISQSIRRLRLGDNVFTSSSSIMFNETGKFYTATLPERAKQFISHYDNDQQVDPFSFWVTFETFT